MKTVPPCWKMYQFHSPNIVINNRKNLQWWACKSEVMSKQIKKIKKRGLNRGASESKIPAHVSGLILPDVSYHGTARNKGRRDFIEALGSKERLIYVAISRSRTTFKFPQGNLWEASTPLVTSISDPSGGSVDKGATVCKLLTFRAVI